MVSQFVVFLVVVFDLTFKSTLFVLKKGRGEGSWRKSHVCFFSSSPSWLLCPRNWVSGRQPIWKHPPQESLKFGREQMILMVFWDSCQPQSITSHLWRHIENWQCLNMTVNNPGRIRCICANKKASSYVMEISYGYILLLSGLNIFI